jgi:flagellar basal-body rod protein FlgG
MPSDSLVTAASAIDVAQRRHDVVAENVANASTTGFKRRLGSFRPFDETLARKLGRIPAGAPGEVAYDFSPGELRHTGGEFDVALDGDGFFAIQTAAGLRFTRNGAFAVNGTGEIVTRNGALVLGTSGPIRVNFPGPPPTFSAGGEVIQDGAVLGTLRVVDFADKRLLAGDGGHFAAGAGAVERRVATPVRQGYLEASNVSTIEELVEMIVNMRSLEASHKALALRTQLLEKVTNPSR